MDDNLENGDATETRRKTRSGSAKPFTTRELRPVSPTDEDFSRQLMRQSSRVYRELEQLVKAVMALNEWAKVELEFREDQDRIIEKKPHVKKAIEECVAAMAPLYRDFLKNARDGTPAFFILFSHRAEYANAEATRLEREQSDLRTIRRLYLPELLLRHVVALNSAGHILTRDYMLKIMDLATIVATPESGLADDLVATNRMQELVTSFAESSQALLKLNEGSAQRKERRRTRGREGKTLAIWDVGVRNEGD
ncbi:Nucleoporin nup84 [Cryomyces antarcticus]|uniref:Nuclear pore complex protein n=1 Tax=Cryomyces antarcticus TaxID=329879 RepID=A0ABR0K1H6_9PEZI|nr:Nucleoporin nup84 [Cryomyces antarcticus]